MKKRLLLVAIVACLLLVTGCATGPAKPTPESPADSTAKPVALCGNTTGNLVNDDLAVQNGDWFYFANARGNLSKMRKNGTGYTELEQTSSEDLYLTCINVVDGWIYYGKERRFDMGTAKQTTKTEL